MAKKEKVSILREEQFEEVESALTDAIANLEATNERIAALLNSDTHELPDIIDEHLEDNATDAPADAPADTSAEPAEEDTEARATSDDDAPSG